jgi:hypothetical protein
MIRKRDLIEASDLMTIQLAHFGERLFKLERRVNELESAARTNTSAPKKRGRKPKNAQK